MLVFADMQLTQKFVTGHAGGPPAAPHMAPPGFQPSTLAQTEAQKFAKYAVSSLSFDDVSSAVKYLNDALKLLTDPSAQPKGR